MSLNTGIMTLFKMILLVYIIRFMGVGSLLNGEGAELASERNEGASR